MARRVILNEAQFVNLMDYNKYASDLLDKKIIWLKDIGEFYLPLCTDAVTLLGDNLIPKSKFDFISHRFVRKGYCFAIKDSTENPMNDKENEEIYDLDDSINVKNPCANCKLRDICDKDYCPLRG